MNFYESLKNKLKNQKTPSQVYIVAIQTEQGRYRSLCGGYAFRNNRTGWKANGFHIYITKEAAVHAWNNNLIAYEGNGHGVVVLVEAFYDYVGDNRGLARNIKPIQSICTLSPLRR